MKIKVELFSFLCNLIGRGENRYSIEIEMEQGTTGESLLRVFNFPPDIPLLIFVNGIVKDGNYVLKEGDKVIILPPLEGG
ncbi:hypothetical protein D4S03_11465 [bacterium]|nr:MAG: hypothetical protein D4S03_11465 [bacterium]